MIPASTNTDWNWISSALVKVSGADGKSIFNGKEATAFSDAEEAALGTADVSCAFQSRRVFFNGE